MTIADGWVLIDARQRHRERPDTFWIPSDHEKKRLKAGDLVKIGVEHETQPGERFWVAITERRGDWLAGRVDNDLVTDCGLDYNDRVEFTLANILMIHG